MTLRYLPESAEAARLTLVLAEREAAHLFDIVTRVRQQADSIGLFAQ